MTRGAAKGSSYVNLVISTWVPGKTIALAARASTASPMAACTQGNSKAESVMARGVCSTPMVSPTREIGKMIALTEWAVVLSANSKDMPSAKSGDQPADTNRGRGVEHKERSRLAQVVEDIVITDIQKEHQGGRIERHFM